jgi:hypothetical protein
LPSQATEIDKVAALRFDRELSGSEEGDVVLSWGAVIVRLRCAAGPTIGQVVARFSGLTATIADQSGAPDFIVEDIAGRYAFTVAQPSASYTFSSRSELLVSLFAEICAAIRTRTTAVVLHGGAFLGGGEAVILAGDANAGKSTLCARSWLRGVPLLGDDHIVYDPDAKCVSPFPRIPLKVRADDSELVAAVDEFAGERNIARGRTEEGPCVCVGREAPGVLSCGQSWPLGALYFVERARRTAMRPIMAREAIHLMLRQVQPGAASIRIASLVTELGRRGRLFALTVGDCEQDTALALIRGQT